MNAARRKRLRELAEAIGPMVDELEQIRDEEQDYFDNMPDAIQAGERGSLSGEAIEHFDEALEALQSAVDLIEQGAA